MTVSTYGSSTSSRQPELQVATSVEKEIDYIETIAGFKELAHQSTSPEIHYQGMSILHFKNNHIVKALKAVELAEEYAQKNGTAPLSIYLALFLRAKYKSSSENLIDLEMAKQDLGKISVLKEISEKKKLEIKALHNVVMGKLQAYEKRIRKRNAEKGIPVIKPPKDCAKISNNLQPAIETHYSSNLKKFLKLKCDTWAIKRLRNIDNINQSSTTEAKRQLYDVQDKIYSNAFNMYTLAHSLSTSEPEIANRIYKETAQLMDEVIMIGKTIGRPIVCSYYCRGHIHLRFGDCLRSLKYLEEAIEIEKTKELEPSDDLIRCKVRLEKEMLAMNAKDRLLWINIALRKDKKNPDLLIWKMEAHFILNEETQGIEAANDLLTILDKKHPYYEIAFRMANSHFSF